MKLARYGEPGAECPAVLLEDGTRVDVSSYVRDFDEAFFGGDGIEALGAWLAGPGRSAPKVPATSRIGCPIARPSKIVCIGLNFRDHAAESDMDLPKEPVIFFKASTALAGPNDPVRIPRGGTKLDWEVELAVVIGRAASYVDESHALDHVAGYNMIFGVANLVSYISQFMTLLPGDVISTGTPAGVGLGMKPEPMYLRAGDVVELGIDGLGQSRQEVIAHA